MNLLKLLCDNTRVTVLIVLILALQLWVVTSSSTNARVPQSPPFSLQVSFVDAVTGATKTTFFLGEQVVAIITLTNQSGVAQIVPTSDQLKINITLSGQIKGADGTVVKSLSLGGGSDYYIDSDGTIVYRLPPATTMTLGPGQSDVTRIDNLASLFNLPLDEGTFTLAASYNVTVQSQAAFTVAVDQTKTIPVLQQKAQGQNSDDAAWAGVWLNRINMPSISGRIVDPSGNGVGGVLFKISGSETTNAENLSDGTFDLTQLILGGNYVFTPSLLGYTFDPPSRTVSNLTGHVTNVNFTAIPDVNGINVSSKQAGAVAVASSSASNDDYPIASVIDGSVTGIGFGQGSGGWMDGTPNVFPDWVEIDFPSAKAIDWINVYTLPDNFTTPVPPTLSETFTLYGITDYDVQYWDGSAWATVPGGSVNGNNNVWRKFTFPTVTTSKIRVNVRNGLGGQSRITEIEAFHINVPPTVQIPGTYTGAPGTSIQFNSTAADSDGTIISYAWDFGDSTPVGAGASPSHTYNSPGTYQVVLTVTDNSGDTASATTTVTITNPPVAPQASAGGPYQGTTGVNVEFDGSDSTKDGGSIVSYQWDFGDNSTGSGIKPVHTYNQTGSYTVGLLVTDNTGMTASATTTATIVSPTPFIHDLDPYLVASGSAGITVTVNGGNFVNGSIVRITGAPRPTTFVSPTQLSVIIPSGDLLVAAGRPITVINPSGMISDPITFGILGPLGPPTLTAASANNKINLSWTPPASTGGSAITSYNIYRGATTGTEAFLISVGNVISYSDTSVTNGNSYYYRIKAVNGTGEGPASNEASAVPVSATGVLAAAMGTTAPSDIWVLLLSTETVGYSFVVNRDGQIDGLGGYYGGAQKVTLWDSSGNVLATSNSARSNNWTLAPITPVAVTAGQTYWVGLYIDINTGGATFDHPSPIVGDLTITGGYSCEGDCVLGSNNNLGLQSGRWYGVPDLHFVPFPSSSNPTPVLAPLALSVVPPGSAFSMTINGSGFTRNAVVRVNGSDWPTTFVNFNQLSVTFSAADTSAEGVLALTVFNPSPGGGTSNSQSLTVTQNGFGALGRVLATTLPFLTNQHDTNTKGYSFIPNINGLITGLGGYYNGTSKVTLWDNAGNVLSSLNVTGANKWTIVPISPVAVTAGTTYWVGVVSDGTAGSATFNGSSPVVSGNLTITGGYYANGDVPLPTNHIGFGSGIWYGTPDVQFSTGNPVPSITGLAPATVAIGSASPTLTINGSNFVNSSVAWVNGLSRATTYVSASQVIAALSSSDVASAGNLSITVSNPTPGGGVSNANTLAVVNPSPNITSITPSSATAGSAGFTLTVNGSSFVNGSVVRVKGSDRSTTFISSMQLSAVIPSTDLITSGGLTVSVFNPGPGGGLSSSLPLSVNSSTPVGVPANLVAAANSTSSVSLVWIASSGPVAYYQVQRASNFALAQPFVTLSTTASISSFTDTGLLAGTAYVYRVRAVDANGNPSAFSNNDLAITFSFTDDPVVPGVTMAKAVHVTELRQAVNAVRATAGLSAATWVESVQPGTSIKASHILELRSNLDAALSILGIAVPAYTNPNIAPGSPIRAADIQDLRQRLK